MAEEPQAQPEQAAPETTAAPAAEKGAKGFVSGVEALLGGDYRKAFKDISAMVPPFKSADGTPIPGVKSFDLAMPKQLEKMLSDTGDIALNNRKYLKQRLELWKRMLNEGKSADDLAKNLEGEEQKYEQNLSKNLKTIHEATHDLEIAYRGVDQFFNNAKLTPEDEVIVHFANISTEQLTDPNDREAFDTLNRLVREDYDKWSLAGCYSLCVIPGYIGDPQAIDEIGKKMAEPNRLFLVTDLPDYDNYEDVKDLLEGAEFANLSSMEKHKQNLAICCNYVQARAKTEYEDDDLWVPPSSTLAGMIYQTDQYTGVQQGAAGHKYGRAMAGKYMRFPVSITQNTFFKNKAVIPTVEYDGGVCYQGDWTLSKDKTFKFYPVKRVFDYIYKNLAQYLNRSTFTVVDDNMIKDLRQNLIDYMNRMKNKRTGMLEDGEVDIDVSRKAEGIVRVNFKNIKPKYPVHHFGISLKVFKDDNDQFAVEED